MNERQLFLVVGFIWLSSFCFGAAAQTWNYQAYRNVGGTPQQSAMGDVTLDEKGGKPTFQMTAGQLDQCYQTPLDAVVERTDETITITIVPLLRGCGDVRFVIKKDGTGGRREVKAGSGWRWDGLDRGLSIKK